MNPLHSLSDEALQMLIARRAALLRMAITSGCVFIAKLSTRRLWHYGTELLRRQELPHHEPILS